MRIPSTALHHILTARGLDIATLADRSNVSATKIRSAMDKGGDLEEEDIISIADELAVPIEALFARESLPLFPAVDFRSATPKVTKFQKGTLEAISFVERLSSTFSGLKLDYRLDRSLAAVKPTYTDAQAIELAREWRKKWGISDDDQLDFQDANKLYVSLRGFIESLGIIVMHRSFETDEAAGLYAHISDGPHIVVINATKSSKARKLFTLAHEFCHVLLRAEGASNPSILTNRVERFCNKFAAYLLAPTRVIKAALKRFRYTVSADDDFIRLFAKKLGISQEALVLRLVEEGMLTPADYNRWRSKFNGVTPPGDTGDGSGGRGDPLQTKRTAYGSALLHLLGEARRTGQLDEIDIFRLCGLKPKYQNQLFEAI
ncbi:ImmA/IrrE family metallo-endopeptidase (plasmid) [Rhizobium ruizarguesonis]|nr:ImmA/IrrE family metallo-endopeptidase [Rhizobium ruizarguesonis]